MFVHPDNVHVCTCIQLMNHHRVYQKCQCTSCTCTNKCCGCRSTCICTCMMYHYTTHMHVTDSTGINAILIHVHVHCTWLLCALHSVVLCCEGFAYIVMLQLLALEASRLCPGTMFLSCMQDCAMHMFLNLYVQKLRTKCKQFYSTSTLR